MKKLLLLPFLFINLLTLAQLPAVNVCLGTDANVCQGQQVNIDRCVGAAGSGLYLDNPSLLTFQDDEYSPAVNIGFNFDFYGNTYNQMTLGSNGIVSFDLSTASAYCPWSSAPLPNTTSGVNNTISISWQDLFFPFAGGLVYQTIGTAPNRQFVISYENVSYFSTACQTPSDCFTASIVLTEGTNTVDMFISNKSFCLAWNNGLAVQGIQDATGTNAVVVPGRNNTAWAAQLDGQRFTPVNATNYTLTTIPFTSVTSSVSTTTQWANTAGQTFPYVSGTPLNVSNPPAGTTGYFLTAATCGASIASISDTTFITVLPSTVSATCTPDVCNLGIGTATATPVAGNAPYTYSWSNGGNTQTITGLLAGSYTVTMTTAELCPSTATVVVTSPAISYSGTTTPVNCPNGSDGTATANMSPSSPGISYLWDDPMAQTTQTATGLTAGNYNCTVSTPTGCIGNVTVTITEIPAMIATLVTKTDVPCHGGTTGMVEINVVQGTPGYLYAWDKSNSTTNTALDLSVGANTTFITDANGCTTSITTVLTEPTPLAITFLTPDTVICPENSINLVVTGTGGSTPFTYTWTENNVIAGTGTSINVNPLNSGTQYCVTLTEECGSQPTQSCMNITFPTAITPSLVPNLLEACTPAKFEFTNTSSPASEISTTEFEFGDGSLTIEQLSDSTSHTYLFADNYTVTMTVKSIYNCVYTATFNDLIEALPMPQASFNIISNPTTIFETTVQMQENSSSDVVNWVWSSPFSNTTSSTAQNPKFEFPDGVAGEYPITLYVTTAEGCTDSTVRILSVISDVIFYAPNAFTPDGDEHNPTWKVAVDGIDFNAFHLFIFNRWGEIVWESNDVTNEWDGMYKGEKCPDGAYNWIAVVKDFSTDKKQQFTGSISLLR